MQHHIPFLYILNLQHLPYCIRAACSENLLEIRSYAIVCQRTIPHNKIIRLLFCNGSYGFIGDIFIKTSNQETLCNIEYLLASNSCFFYLTGKFNTQIKHYLEQQVFWCSVFFDVIYRFTNFRNIIFIWVIVHIFHMINSY